MVESGGLVAVDVALRMAGAGAEVTDAGPVTYARGADALVMIIPGGDRISGSRLASREGVELREPFPLQVTDWLSRFDVPRFGFVRLPEGCLALGELREVRRVGGGLLERAMGRISAAEVHLRQVDLALMKPLPFALLDFVRPLKEQPVPGIDWLADVPHDRVAALCVFLEGWYADVPSVQPEVQKTPMRLPAALAAFYGLAARKPVIYGVHNSVYPPHELAYDEDEGGVVFAAENQGVWVKVIDPEQEDPQVYDDGEPDWEPLSGVLLQFALVEAVMSAPYAGHAEITERQRDHFVAGLARVPLGPATFPGQETSIHVAPGVVAIIYPYEDGFQLRVGSRHSAGLRALRDPGFAWESFND
jgi:hypothetical protein